MQLLTAGCWPPCSPAGLLQEEQGYDQEQSLQVQDKSELDYAAGQEQPEAEEGQEKPQQQAQQQQQQQPQQEQEAGEQPEGEEMEEQVGDGTSWI